MQGLYLIFHVKNVYLVGLYLFSKSKSANVKWQTANVMKECFNCLLSIVYLLLLNT